MFSKYEAAAECQRNILYIHLLFDSEIKKHI